MSNDEQSYNLTEIRKLLTVFDDSDLSAWCLDNFSKVYDQFTRGMSKKDKITILLDYCRREPTRFDKLLAIVRREDEEAFKRFEPSLTSKVNYLLLGRLVERRTEFERLFGELNEWKSIHHDVQDLLSDVDKGLSFLTWYKFKKDPDWLELAFFAWQELQASKLKSIPDNWSFQYVASSSLSQLQNHADQIDNVAGKLINDISEAEFKAFYLQYRQLRAFLWVTLQSADDSIKILIEKILAEIGE